MVENEMGPNNSLYTVYNVYYFQPSPEKKTQDKTTY